MSIRELPPAFTLEDARAVGITKDQVYSLLKQEEIERVGRGVYVRPDALQPALTALAAATALREDTTLCLTSALVHHDLSDAIQFTCDIALPRGTHQPVGLSNLSWHSLDTASFLIGLEQADAGGGAKVAICSAERSIVDTFRLTNQEGSDVAHESLRRWFRRRGNTPAGLLKVAGLFPKALPRIRQALEALL